MSGPDRSGDPFAVANGLTACNLVCGIAATLCTADGRQGRRAALILLGGFFDALDGPLARSSGAPTEFGAAADGVADFISGGMAPALLLANYSPTRRTPWAKIAPGFYLAAAAWRLARRGMKPRTSQVFSGLPIIGAGMLMAAGSQIRLPHRVMTYLATALGLAMASDVRLLSIEALIRGRPPPNMSDDYQVRDVPQPLTRRVSD
jgi:phosphatidylserine synthase